MYCALWHRLVAGVRLTTVAAGQLAPSMQLRTGSAPSQRSLDGTGQLAPGAACRRATGTQQIATGSAPSQCSATKRAGVWQLRRHLSARVSVWQQALLQWPPCAIDIESAPSAAWATRAGGWPHSDWSAPSHLRCVDQHPQNHRAHLPSRLALPAHAHHQLGCLTSELFSFNKYCMHCLQVATLQC